MNTPAAQDTPLVASFFDPATWTFTHVAYDRPGGHAAVIDPVLDFDPKSGRTAHRSAQQVVDFVKAHDLTVDWILETHAHADHLSAAPFLREQLGGQITIGHRITQVQQTFQRVFNLGPAFPTDGRQFDRLLEEGETFTVGSVQAVAWHVPGHTQADMAYVMGNAVFVGDTLFPPDVGTARCDFPGGNAAQLYQSVQRLLALPDDTRLYMCHDYPPTDREPQSMSTVAQQRQHNIHIREGVTQDDFVQMRQQRDATLAMPNLILPSIQVNIRAGQMPEPEHNGVSYLKLPVNAL